MSAEHTPAAADARQPVDPPRKACGCRPLYHERGCALTCTTCHHVGGKHADDCEQAEASGTAGDERVSDATQAASPAARRRTTLTVTIDLDPFPGWGHVAEDHQRWLQQYLDRVIGHYHPTVEIAQAEARSAAPSGDTPAGDSHCG